jgi:ubiquinone biosynthesis protein
VFAKFKKEVRNLKRLEEIVGVFAKYGFGYIIQKLPFHPLAAKTPSEKNAVDLPLNVRLRKVLEELGPTFIKLGQMLSLRPDIIPYEFCKEFEKLQDNVPPAEFTGIKGVLENEFKKPLDTVFKDFPETPLASASLAQVYEVKLNHKKAIVKVQKPGLREMIEADLEILEFLANLIDKHVSEARIYDPRGLLQEFKTYITKELDFNNESINIEKFRYNFLGDEKVYFPLVYRHLCSDKVLVIEKVSGVKISDLEGIEALGLDKKKLVRVFVDCVLKQIFIDGFFHADPHPGNVFVLEDGRISFVDFGIVGRLDEDSKFRLVDVLIASFEKDVDRISDILMESDAVGYTDERKLKLALELVLDRYHGISLEEFKMNDFLKGMARLMYENKVRLLSENFLLIKTLAILESVGKTMDPGLNFTLEVKKLMDAMIKEEYSIKRIGRKIQKVSRDVFNLAQNFPKDLVQIISEIKRGNLKIGFEHLNLEGLISMLDKLSNRLSFSLIISALIISSSLLIQANPQALMGTARHLGVMGFILAVILGLWLLINIMRSGKL